MTEDRTYQIRSPRVLTTHGKKRNQGMLAVVNNKVALCFTEGEDETVTGYTPLEDIMKASCTVKLQVISLEF